MSEVVELLRSIGRSFLSGPVDFGQALDQTGQANFFHASSALTTTLQAGNATAALTYTLPTAGPTENSQPLIGTTAGVLSWGTRVGKGTATNDDAAAGDIGEYITQKTLRSAPVSLTTATPANVLGTALTLTAGDWLMSGAVGFTPTGTTTITNLIGSISVTSATLSGVGTFAVPDASGQIQIIESYPALVLGNDVVMPFPAYRISLSGSTTFYLVAQGAFGVSTLGAYGFLGAGRRR